MSNAGAGIETGWAMPDASSAESQLPEAGGISGGGPFPTEVGPNFDALLQALGGPAAPNGTDPPNGILPPHSPTTCAAPPGHRERARLPSEAPGRRPPPRPSAAAGR